ncbi:MAG: Arginase [Candidatus Saccharibacteria bacterium]|nr:Arginase [Candidatus Saccharibacteria bacterium]
MFVTIGGMTPATLIGVPLDLGAENLGVDVGPDAFRYQDLIKKLASAGLEVEDAGNIEVGKRADLSVGDLRLRYLDEIVRVNEALATQVETAIKAGRKVIVLGGDHSLNLGTVAGASTAVDGKIGQVYLDAHGDMNTDESTLTGNIHGMHLASLMGFGAPALAQAYGNQVKLPKENLLHIGGCDLDQAEIDLIARENLEAFTMLDLMKYGMAPLLEKIDALAAKAPNVWVSLDLDAIDKVYAPGAGMPNPKGLTYREVVAIAEYVGQKCNVIGLDVVEYNPLQDIDRKTAELGTELIATFLGKQYSWYSGYLEQNKLD